MRIQIVRSAEVSFVGAETALVVPVFANAFPVECEALAEADELLLQALIDKEVLTGKALACPLIPTPASAYKNLILLGLGERAKCTPELVRRAAGKACGQLAGVMATHVYLDLTHCPEVSAEAFIEGIILGQYDFDVLKSRDEDQPAPVKVEEIVVLCSAAADLDRLQIQCDRAGLIAVSANMARHLANTPPNEMNPTALAAFAQGIAEQGHCECTILEETQMATLGMNALLGVSSGSAEPPRLIVLRYHASDDAKTVAIVGKGVTFDSGGISIKPAESMHEMKYDMCGAAAVLCTMLNVVEMKPNINVICVVPAVENMTGSRAQRPGDIVRAYNGKSIEVLNTDAEGRLILADAMSFTVDKYAPDVMVNLATLTGAVVVALGHYAAGIFGNNDELSAQLQAAGEATGERCWPMPLWDDYCALIEGTHADLSNIGPRGEAGAITAAAFLKAFVGDTPWAHLDIAGTAWGAKNVPYLDPKHASGYGVRLLTKWILDQAEA
jgi:leucyl aminopeptidase